VIQDGVKDGHQKHKHSVRTMYNLIHIC